MLTLCVGRNTPHPASRDFSVQDLHFEIAGASAASDLASYMKGLEHLATADGRYYFPGRGNLTERNRDIRPRSFENWLEFQWRDIEVEDD
jgi:hypothetical protein